MNYMACLFEQFTDPVLNLNTKESEKEEIVCFFLLQLFFSLKKNYLFKLFIYFMSKIIKHSDKSCVGITNDWTVCLCLFISGQSDTETCTRNSPSRGRQYNQNNISRNFLSFLSFSLSPLAHQTLKPKVTF